MFSNKEKKMLGGSYFTVIREEDRFIEVMSRCTKHCWMIFRKVSATDKPLVLYHKHTADTKYYHKQWESWTVAKLIECIKTHDAYVLECKKGETNGI